MDRDRFDTVLKKLASMAVQDSERLSAGVLPQAPLYEFRFDIAERCWKPWKAYVTAYAPPPDGRFSKIVVPTVDTVRSTWLLNCVVSSGKPCLLVGQSGTAKSVTVQNYLETLPAQDWMSLGIAFSSRTTSAAVQAALEDSTENVTRDTLAPAFGKKLALFIDDMNMPKVDTYGTQQPIALLKLFVDRKGLYDRSKELSWRNVKNVQVVGAMGPPGGARNPVDPRFISLFTTFEVQFPSNENLSRIYENILASHAAKLSRDVLPVTKLMTAATLELYNFIIETLPPTPSRFHYIFNLRDLSRIYEGLLLSTPDKVPNAGAMVRLWRHECMRIFHDRLISKEDKEVVLGQIEKIVTDKFAAQREVVLQDPVLFGDFVNMLEPSEPRLYEDLGDFEKVKPIVEEILAEYNTKQKAMNLVFFDDAMEHFTRMLRTVRLDQGNLLLVGVGGSGKQSLTRLAAFAAGCIVFEITLTRGYDETAFRDDLKTLYGLLGQENKKVVFLFTDSHVVDEGFLELINNMLTSGIVPGLFEQSDKDAACNSVRDEVERLKLPNSPEGLWSYFVAKCRRNLHVVLAMSPVGETLRTRCR